MEKYSKWRDGGTGIQPFLPPKPRISDVNQVLWYIKKFVVGPLFAVIKLPFILVIILWLGLMTVISFLIPVPLLRRGFSRYVNALGARVLLFLLGFYWIEVVPVELRKGLPHKASHPQVNAGDILLCNRSSYVELLYLAFRYAPMYVTPPNAGKKEESRDFCVSDSLFPALWRLIRETPLSASHPGVQRFPAVLQLAASNYSPVAVFPEGATTVGNCVLTFSGLLNDLPSFHPVHIVSFRYDYDDFCPAYSVGSFFWHILRMIAQLHNKLEVRVVDSEHLAEFVKDFKPESSAGLLATSASDTALNSASSHLSQQSSNYASALATALRVRKVALTAQDKLDFRDYYYGHAKAYKKD